MKKWLIGALVVLGFSSLATSQATGFGVRAGYPIDLGVQFTTSDTAGLRFAGGLDYPGVGAQVDYLIHQPLPVNGLTDLSLYYGGGAHAQVFFFYGFGVELGGQGTFGVEWAFAPTLSAFWEASAGLGFGFGDWYYLSSGIRFYGGSSVGLNFRS
ncbi:MAG TPA: hypothetical protein VHN99_11505 [Deinococcales bacterium]|nr:hypothetical protein [Deinococcales bacterium]